MSTVLILTPIIISNWPAIMIAATGAASALGFLAKEAVKDALQDCGQSNVEKSVEVQLPDSQVLSQNMATDQQIVLTKGSVQICVKRDERGRCSVCAKGTGHSEVELKQMAQEFTNKLIQCYVYDRVVKELKNKQFQIINEEVMDDQSIRVNVRRWVD